MNTKKPVEGCCSLIQAQLNFHCSEHAELIECADALVGQFGPSGMAGPFIHDVSREP
jgi:hypothetical protein